MNSQTLQIKTLLEQGYSAEQIAMGLNLNEEAVKLVVAGLEVGDKKAKTFEDRFGDVEVLATMTLKEIASTGSNESARVMAAKILLERKEALNSKVEFSYDEIAERLEKSRKVSSKEKEPEVVDKEKVIVLA